MSETVNTQSIISIKDVVLGYTPELDIIKGVSLEVQPGEVIALLGHNGSGKSTLLKSLIALVKIKSGSIMINKQSLVRISKKDLRAVRSSTGMIFQNHNLVKRISVLSNIIHGLLGKESFLRNSFQFLASQKNRMLAFQKLQEVKLGEFALRRADQLSGGQSQRIAIARALMQNPQILLADEPTASLDPQAGEDIMELLSSLAKDKGITLMFTTHDLEHARKYATRVIALKNGVIDIDSPTTEINFNELNYLYE